MGKLVRRPYQTLALQKSLDARVKDNVRRQLIQLPTGMGKTVVFASVPDFFKLQKRMIVLAHREELVEQAAATMRRWNPTRSVGIEMADKFASPGDQIVVASPQSLHEKRLQRFDPSEVEVVVCDEAHHYVAPSYLKVLNHFGLKDDNSQTLFIGVTATPNRGDGKAMAQAFDKIVSEYSMMDGILDGWLSDLNGYKVYGETELDQVRTVAGDFNQGELSDAVNNPKRNGLIVRAWIDNTPQLRTIAFCVDVQHAKDLARAFQTAGVPADAIWGEDPRRQEKLAQHKAGELQVLTNCNLLTEGYDDWEVRCIVMARPTKSQLLYTQMAGRGTRIPPAEQMHGNDNLNVARNEGVKPPKENCYILDIVDNTSRHSLVTLPSLFGMNTNLDLKGKSITRAVRKIEELEEVHPNVDFGKLTDITQIKAHVEAVKLFDYKVPEIIAENSKLRWHQNFDGSFCIRLPKPKKEDLEFDQGIALEGEEKPPVADPSKWPLQKLTISKDMFGKFALTGAVQDQLVNEKGFDTFKDAVTFAELTMSAKGKWYINLLKRDQRNSDVPVTDNQWGLLTKLFAKKRDQSEWIELQKMKAKGELTKGKASHIIDNAIHRKFQTRQGVQ